MKKLTVNNIFKAALLSLASAGLLLGLIALLIHFYIFPNINDYKDDIAAKISEKTGLNVEIGQIKVDWDLVEPHLTLSNITLLDQENRPALTLEDTEALISWFSLPQMTANLHKLLLKSPTLTIRRTANGEIFVAGISTKGKSNPKAKDWLLQQQSIEVQNATVTWIDEMRGAPPLSVSQLDIELSNPVLTSIFDEHVLTISGIPSVGTNKPVNIRSEFYGESFSKLEDWAGHINIDLKDAHMPEFKEWIDQASVIQSASGNAKLKIAFYALKAEEIKADLDLNNIRFKPKKHAPVTLDHLTGKVHWQQTRRKLTIDLHDVAVKHKQLNFKSVNGQYQRVLNADEAEHSVQLQLSTFDLKALHDVKTLPISADIKQTISALSPSGELNNINIVWQGKNDKTLHFDVKSQFKNLSISAYEKIPGFTNLSGIVNATEKNGSIQLNAKNATIDLQRALRQPIHNNQLKGSVSWQVKENEQAIKVSSLKISNPHLSGKIKGTFTISENGPVADLTGEFDQLTLNNAHYYFPRFLRENTLRWLDNAFIAGTGHDVKVIIKGPMKAFPFVDKNKMYDPTKGTFKVTSKIHDGVVHYGNNWPNVEDVTLDMKFEGPGLTLSNCTGRLLGNHIESANFIIPTLDIPDQVLSIKGKLAGPVSEAILFINRSPVSRVTQGFTDDLKTTGSGKLDLSLDIPLKHSKDTAVKGLYQFDNATLASDGIPTLSNIQGGLRFTENGISAEAVEAIAYDVPVILDIHTENKAIYIQAKGQANSDLMNHFVANADQYMAGATDVTANIEIKKPDVNVSVKSDLIGITSYLPAPLNKSANEAFALSINKNQTPESDLVDYHIGNWFDAQVLQSRAEGNNTLQGISINTNGHLKDKQVLANTNEKDNNDYVITRPDGLNIKARLGYLNVDAWRETMDKLFPPSHSDAHLAINTLDVNIKSADSFGKRFNQVTLEKSPSTDDSTVSIKSKELSGDITWVQENNGKIIAKLSHLSVPEDAPDNRSDNPLFIVDRDNYTVVKLDEAYPAIDLDTKSFYYKDQDIGELILLAKPTDDDWQIDHFQLINQDSTLTASGLWANLNQNPETQLKIDWSINDLGNTLAKLGHAETISGGKGHLKGDIAWTGSPQDFALVALNGDLNFDFKSGEILKVKPGVGRLLGLVSLQSLPRRLTLDFSDLFSNGFAFDKIKSNIKVTNGNMQSDNFVMDGPAAEVMIKGEADLKHETQNLNVKVLPRISDSLSLAALAGGPLAGAVAFLAQKVLKDPLNKVISTEYQITGTWDNPVEMNVKKEENSVKRKNGLR